MDPKRLVGSLAVEAPIKRVSGCGVVFLFASCFCARPLAGPPERRAGSAIALDP